MNIDINMRTLNSRFGMIPHKGNSITRNENDISSNDDDEVSELDKSLTLNLSPTVVREINEMVGAIEDEDESVEEESVCEESEDVSAIDDVEGTIQYALRSPAKLYEGGAEETFVRQKETKRHSRSPNKIVKHVGIEYMHTKKNRERAMKRRVEGIKFIHTKLEFYKENDDRKPPILTPNNNSLRLLYCLVTLLPQLYRL